MKTQELIEYLEKTPGNKLTKADEKIIQRLREYDELKKLVSDLADNLKQTIDFLNGI